MTEPKIIGLLSWYDEDPDVLAACVNGLAVAQVTHLVAMDGPYQHYPHDKPYSSHEERKALILGCDHHGISLTLHARSSPWPTEIAKRTALFALGHAHATPYDDWLLVIDADEVITHADHTPLHTTGYDVATMLSTTMGMQPPDRHRRYFRAHPQGIRVHQHHYNYVDGEGRRLRGPHSLIGAEDLDAHCQHNPLRGETRHHARTQYYAERRRLNLEPDVI
jgi:PAS domain-containing protein